MRFDDCVRPLVALMLLGVTGLLPQAAGLAGPDLYPGAETVEVRWMSGVINSGRACVGRLWLHDYNAYDLIADNSADPYCYDGGVPATVKLRTLGYSSTTHATLRTTMSSGEYTNGCDYVEARAVQQPTGTVIGTYRYLHANGTSGQWVDIWAGPTLLPTETAIGSTTYDSDCTPGWEGYHTHQDSGYPTCPCSQPNTGLPRDDDIPVWNSSYWIHKWTYALPDTDGDDFQDAAEAYMGTDRLDACADTTTANDENPDPQPPDFDDNRVVDITDAALFMAHFPSAPGSPNWSVRFDLNANAVIDITDASIFLSYLPSAC